MQDSHREVAKFQLYNAHNRKEWVDLGKGISILLVVLFHCETYLPIVNTGTGDTFSFFRMPFFFFLSGYVFVSDYRQFSLRRKLKQILRGIVWTYLIFTCLIIVPKSLLNGKSIAEGLSDIFLGYASWFVVSLGVAQVAFAILLANCKRLWVCAIFMLSCVTTGLFIQSNTQQTLPFQIEKALIVVLFLGLGFFYRIYEPLTEKYFRPFYLLIGILIYASLMYMENHILKERTSNLFWNNGVNNFPLYFLYAFTGIATLLLIVKQAKTKNLHLICYIGTNSLIFYYLNGGIVKCWRFIYTQIETQDLKLPEGLGFTLVYLSVCATLLITSYLIRKYVPVIMGDKTTFNRIFPFWKW